MFLTCSQINDNVYNFKMEEDLPELQWETLVTHVTLCILAAGAQVRRFALTTDKIDSRGQNRGN